MARPKLYSSAAEKQNAYRRRLREEKVIVDRGTILALYHRLEELREAILKASDRGDAFAHRCAASSVDTMLGKLTVAFNQQNTDVQPLPSTPRTSRKELRKK
jgi:hypothetical protein